MKDIPCLSGWPENGRKCPFRAFWLVFNFFPLTNYINCLLLYHIKLAKERKNYVEKNSHWNGIPWDSGFIYFCRGF